MTKNSTFNPDNNQEENSVLFYSLSKWPTFFYQIFKLAQNNPLQHNAAFWHTKDILNQKRNFRKIGLRGGHTRYERKKKKIDTYLKWNWNIKWN